MSRNLDPQSFVATAIEATYYIAPAEPGLSEGDLLEIGASLDLRPGELRDAIRESSMAGHLNRKGELYQLPEGYLYATLAMTWEGSPRSPELQEAIIDILVEHIREHGKSHLRVELDDIHEALAGKGYTDQKIVSELALMQVARILRKSEDAILISEQAAAGFGHRRSFPSSPGEHVTMKRPDFQVVFDAVQSHAQTRPPPSPEAHSMTKKRRVFISHSSANAELAKLIVDYLKATLVVHADREIFCSSLPGHELMAGDNAEAELAAIIRETRVIIGLLTPEALMSPAVLMELGAAWALEKHFVPVLFGAEFSEIPSWVSRHAINLEKSAEDSHGFTNRVISLSQAIAKHTAFELRPPAEQSTATIEFYNRIRLLP